MNALWISSLGEVICEKHAGNYLKTAIKNNPLFMSHSTPLDDWQLQVTDYACEDCVGA